MFNDRHTGLCFPSRCESLSEGLEENQLKTIHLHSFADASFAPYRFNNRRCLSGGAVYFERSLVRTTSKQQQALALSSCEAELYALQAICQESIAFSKLTHRLMFSLGEVEEREAVHVYMESDSSSAIQLLRAIDIPKKSRHVEIRLLWLREQLGSGQLFLKHRAGTSAWVARTSLSIGTRWVLFPWVVWCFNSWVKTSCLLLRLGCGSLLLWSCVVRISQVSGLRVSFPRYHMLVLPRTCRPREFSARFNRWWWMAANWFPCAFACKYSVQQWFSFEEVQWQCDWSWSGMGGYHFCSASLHEEGGFEFIWVAGEEWHLEQGRDSHFTGAALSWLRELDQAVQIWCEDFWRTSNWENFEVCSNSCWIHRMFVEKRVRMQLWDACKLERNRFHIHWVL